MRCGACGRQFEHQRSTRRYCSNGCRQWAYRQREEAAAPPPSRRLTWGEACRRLGLTSSHNADQLRTAYRHSAFATHPDRGGTAAGFVSIQKAYEYLRP